MAPISAAVQESADSECAVTEPLAHGKFTRILSLAHIVPSDSGGVRESTPSPSKAVLVTRDNTERPEAADVTLIGTDEEQRVKEVDRLLNNYEHFDTLANAVDAYGDGKVGERTATAVAQLGTGKRISSF
jgi:UDP-N-acetylglucosamine 2-epimerase (non-hydrolysing)